MTLAWQVPEEVHTVLVEEDLIKAASTTISLRVAEAKQYVSLVAPSLVGGDAVVDDDNFAGHIEADDDLISLAVKGYTVGVYPILLSGLRAELFTEEQRNGAGSAEQGAEAAGECVLSVFL